MSVFYKNIKRSFIHVFINKQHGFKSVRFSITSDDFLLLFIVESVEFNRQLYVIIIYFKKSFDTIHHSLFISELKHLSIVYPLL